MYYRGAAAAVVVFDVTSRESFARAQAWVRELQRQASPGLVIALAGNKADLASAAPAGSSEAGGGDAAAASAPSTSSARAVATADVAAYATAEGGLLFWETGAKEGTNVAELFADVASRLPTRASAAAATAAAAAAGGAGGAGGGNGGITLTQAPPQRNAKAACC